eukprot:6138831-Ditylum_brightwellii.AAC.1
MKKTAMMMTHPTHPMSTRMTMSASTNMRIQTSQECMRKSRKNSSKKMSTNKMTQKLKTNMKTTQNLKTTIRALIMYTRQLINNMKKILLMSTKLANMLRLTPKI